MLVSVECLNCKKVFEKEPKAIKKSPNHFCSRSCACSYNNKAFPKRKCKRKCFCGDPVKSHRHTRCERHWNEWHKERGRYKAITIGEYREKLSVKGKHPSWVNVGIRGLGRTWFKELLKQPCKHCGYNKHVELCHIKPISEFSDDTPLSVVNSPDNVIQLCPNCHWEFDNEWDRSDLNG